MGLMEERKKAKQAKQRIKELNPQIQLLAFSQRGLPLPEVIEMQVMKTNEGIAIIAEDVHEFSVRDSQIKKVQVRKLSQSNFEIDADTDMNDDKGIVIGYHPPKSGKELFRQDLYIHYINSKGEESELILCSPWQYEKNPNQLKFDQLAEMYRYLEYPDAPNGGRTEL